MAQGKKQARADAQRAAREAARQEVERLKAAQAAKERRTRIIGVAIGLVIVIAAAVVVILVQQSTSGSGSTGPRPLGANDAGAIVLGQDLQPGGAPAAGGDAVVIRIYADYLCPNCAEVERRLSASLENLASAGEITLEIQAVDFLARLSNGTEYPRRAANVAATIANYSPEHFLAFHSKLYEEGVQPDEGSDGLTDQRLVELAQEVGVPASVTDRFAASEFAEWVEYATAQAVADGVGGTPGIKMGASDSKLTLVNNPYTLNPDTAIARIRDGQSPD
ncbi:MAG: DsbA family protein [Bifidobacteriaceae bacterium]|jgi:protein-disulfide isomerase|nr:DsbA family protein [Bifidobacteriaceae bacterium]